jgi:hypothetical protein
MKAGIVTGLFRCGHTGKKIPDAFSPTVKPFFAEKREKLMQITPKESNMASGRKHLFYRKELIRN